MARWDNTRSKGPNAQLAADGQRLVKPNHPRVKEFEAEVTGRVRSLLNAWTLCYYADACKEYPTSRPDSSKM